MPKKIIFTAEQESKIIDMYVNEKISTVKIGKEFGVLYGNIIRVLDKYGIKRVRNGIRKYQLNESYFDEINTPNKAYILGFFYADGSNCVKKSTVSMSLQVGDRDILEKIRLEIGSDRELEFINQSKRKDKNNDYHYCDMWRLLLFSSHMCKTLENKGMIQNKSLLLEFPEWLDKKLYSHFIRGYFDGDGSLCNRFTSDNSLRTLLTLTSTEKFCKSVQKIILENTDIPGTGGIYDASSHNGITRVLSYSGHNTNIAILKWLYKDADLFMERKYNKYLELLDIVQNRSHVA